MTTPRLVLDPTTGQYIDTFTGERTAAPPPKQAWRYTVAERPGKPPVTIGQRVFKAGDVLGTGNVVLSYPAIERCWFAEVADYDGPDPIGAGHIFPRLRSGAVLAEKVEAPDDDE